VIYNITHRTTFEYIQSVSISHHLLHLAPRPCPQQVRRHHGLIVEPPPTIIRNDTDYFGNPTTYLTIEEPHRELVIAAKSSIEVMTPSLPAPEDTSPWDKVPTLLSGATGREMLDIYQFVFDSPFTESGNGIADFAAKSFSPERPILEAALELTARIFNDFTYEGGVTDISTPVEEVLKEKRGVCQDFAHLQISCLRSMGLPARYVSGYLLTHPPEGKERLVGADASHAWLSVWVPEHGWIDLDPTNNLIPRDEHITLAWGRDYGDVSPINGLVVGGGQHEIDVSVDVQPVPSKETANES
jgi:transglutaminase-like putative cysteine protease